MIAIIDLRTSLLFFVFLSGLPLRAADLQRVSLSFYSERLTVTYDQGILLPSLDRVEDKQIFDYFHQLKNTNYQPLMDDLQRQRERLKLNDWLYYELMVNTVNRIFSERKQAEPTLFCWFLLSQAGFDTRLTYLDNEPFVYVYTEDEIFEVPMIEDNGRSFVNITSVHLGIKSQPALYMLNFAPNPEGTPFRFYLQQLPLLTPDISKKKLFFVHRQDTLQLQVAIDKTVARLMSDYPFISESAYLEVPLSTTLQHSLVPQLKRLIAGKNAIEAVQLLVSFTRSSFKYKEDKEHFGKSKPMIADEVFHYPYSDCEDRSALFYCLVKELLDFPMIIVAFPDHLTIGVALPEFVGNSVQYEGKDYFICDPTGPANSDVIGEFPYGYEESGFQIIGQYR